ncbi:hypothetical protein GCM10022415_03060 [Knoellia locipacati]|uniref:Pilus assembly protein n=1 Tax=Knoellia locipacati TaxID=882824 RepID=A0A512SWD3_9MICO|nr:Flp family type IVb pilin [Knoellia locipacati]GEQ12258.1 hypothetical protein KLO01_03050 [Knoellia locipacati]
MSMRIAQLRRRLASEAGATMVEYGLMVALVAVVVAVAVTTLGGAISSMFTSVATTI